jgi:type III secretory pathway component EscV
MKKKVCNKCGRVTAFYSIKCPSCGLAFIKNWYVKLLFIILISFIIIQIVSIPKNSNSNQSYSNTKKQSLEYMIAAIDNNGLPESDYIVSQYKNLLISIDSKTIENYEQVCNMTVMVQTQLENRYGVNISLIKILEDMNYSLPENAESNYAEITALYVLLNGK